jgi:hypothetical protein
MPFSEEALDASITELVGPTSELPDFEDGYLIWRQDQGGVFTITVAEAIDFVEQGVQQLQQ